MDLFLAERRAEENRLLAARGAIVKVFKYVSAV
jgi:hypothetical protein